MSSTRSTTTTAPVTPASTAPASAAKTQQVVTPVDHLFTPGGLFDHLGNHLPHAAWQPVLRHLLGEPLITLIKHLGPEHDDVHDAFNGRIHGQWRIDRFDAPIEYYAAKVAGVAEKDLGAFHTLPAAVQVEADRLLKRNHRAVSSEFEEMFENIFLIAGVQALWAQAVGSGGPSNSGSGAAAANAYFNNAQAMIGVGDSSTAAANTQTDLQAASNKAYVGMDATYPTLPSGSGEGLVLRATFGTATANYAWNEFVANNRNASNSTTTGGTTLDRVVSAQGTKASGQTWQPSLTLTIS